MRPSGATSAPVGRGEVIVVFSFDMRVGTLGLAHALAIVMRANIAEINPAVFEFIPWS
jgi:hypothetical protein